MTNEKRRGRGEGEERERRRGRGGEEEELIIKVHKFLLVQVRGCVLSARGYCSPRRAQHQITGATSSDYYHTPPTNNNKNNKI